MPSHNKAAAWNDDEICELLTFEVWEPASTYSYSVMNILSLFATGDTEPLLLHVSPFWDELLNHKSALSIFAWILLILRSCASCAVSRHTCSHG